MIGQSRMGDDSRESLLGVRKAGRESRRLFEKRKSGLRKEIKKKRRPVPENKDEDRAETESDEWKA